MNEVERNLPAFHVPRRLISRRSANSGNSTRRVWLSFYTLNPRALRCTPVTGNGSTPRPLDIAISAVFFQALVEFLPPLLAHHTDTSLFHTPRQTDQNVGTVNRRAPETRAAWTKPGYDANVHARRNGQMATLRNANADGCDMTTRRLYEVAKQS